jgi:hypothetical protein
VWQGIELDCESPKDGLWIIDPQGDHYARRANGSPAKSRELFGRAPFTMIFNSFHQGAGDLLFDGAIEEFIGHNWIEVLPGLFANVFHRL